MQTLVSKEMDYGKLSLTPHMSLLLEDFKNIFYFYNQNILQNCPDMHITISVYCLLCLFIFIHFQILSPKLNTENTPKNTPHFLIDFFFLKSRLVCILFHKPTGIPPSSFYKVTDPISSCWAFEKIDEAVD